MQSWKSIECCWPMSCMKFRSNSWNNLLGVELLAIWASKSFVWSSQTCFIIHVFFLDHILWRVQPFALKWPESTLRVDPLKDFVPISHSLFSFRNTKSRVSRIVPGYQNIALQNSFARIRTHITSFQYQAPFDCSRSYVTWKWRIQWFLLPGTSRRGYRLHSLQHSTFRLRNVSQIRWLC